VSSRNVLIALGLGLLTLMLFFPTAHGGMMLWLLLVLGLSLLFMFDTASGKNEGCSDRKTEETLSNAERERLDSLAAQVLTITGSKTRDRLAAYEGTLKMPARQAVEHIEEAFASNVPEFYLESIEEGEARLVLASPAADTSGPQELPRVRPWIHWSLLLATFLTTTWAGAVHQGADPLRNLAALSTGLPYSLGLLLILGAHEMGHFLTARRYGMQVTPPYFIPVPFALGTFGAFISMRSLPRRREQLFDVAMAGPLAGLVVAIPALIFGLSRSTLIAPSETAVSMMSGGADVGASLVLALLAKLALGTEIGAGHLIQLHPLAFAGWLGLLLTALNLLPIGQLDGGHIARAVFGGRRAVTISRVAMALLFLLALLVWPGLLFFAVLVFLIAGRTGIPPRNDVDELSSGRKWLGYAGYVLLLLIVLPLPHAWYTSFGLHCPYL